MPPLHGGVVVSCRSPNLRFRRLAFRHRIECAAKKLGRHRNPAVRELVSSPSRRCNDYKRRNPTDQVRHVPSHDRTARGCRNSARSVQRDIRLAGVSVTVVGLFGAGCAAAVLLTSTVSRRRCVPRISRTSCPQNSGRPSALSSVASCTELRGVTCRRMHLTIRGQNSNWS